MTTRRRPRRVNRLLGQLRASGARKSLGTPRRPSWRTILWVERSGSQRACVQAARNSTLRSASACFWQGRLARLEHAAPELLLLGAGALLALISLSGDRGPGFVGARNVLLTSPFLSEMR